MNQGLRRGVSALSRTRVLPPRARQWQGTREIQIRSAASEQPDSINAAHFPFASTPNAVQSSGTVPSVFWRNITLLTDDYGK